MTLNEEWRKVGTLRMNILLLMSFFFIIKKNMQLAIVIVILIVAASLIIRSIVRKIQGKDNVCNCDGGPNCKCKDKKKDCAGCDFCQ